jgi:hypothetical protein
MVKIMTKKELFEWAAANADKFPELSLLCEAEIDGESFINLPVRFGVYSEVYYSLEYNPAVYALREQNNCVGVTKTYDTMRKFILECVRKLKRKMQDEKKSKQLYPNRIGGDFY